MNKILVGCLLSTLIVATYGILFHYYNVNPNDWGAVAMWLPVYVSPIWGIGGYSYLTERSKE